MWLTPEKDRPPETPSESRRLQNFCLVSAALNLIFFWLLTMHPRGHDPATPYLYSPAESVVQHKLVKFTRGLADDIPIYERRPSAAVDNAWSALYSVAQIKMSRTEAMKMPNSTWPLLSDRGSYVFTLDIFHQLHCLDTLRKQVSIGFRV
ncbi:hypothetical protein DFH06DRAFT_1301455 [Mycena polygramma]|nr:hypothetical protein DFH06DRAFT_1301455 [Mycena polygramma]